MKQTLLYILSVLLSLQLAAQSTDSARDSFSKAEMCYKTGKIEEALRLLEENLPAYKDAMHTGAYRLTALCLLALDRFQEADRYVTLLLKDEPYYYISLQDPERLQI